MYLNLAYIIEILYNEYMKKIYLSGVKPTGNIHLGNYLGMIKPSVELLDNNPDDIFLFFIADYHALNAGLKDIKENTYKILATYISFGLDPSRVCFYKQSDIGQIFELQTILNNFAPKSLLNSSHAYKTKIEDNKENNRDIDTHINMGLYSYPILMASDILLFNADYVPVGQDQIQHIEIARELARRFNDKTKKILKEPEAYIQNPDSLIGIDGRKMSKSYQNEIGLYLTEKQLKKRIGQIVTDSLDKDAPKPKENNVLKIAKPFLEGKDYLSLENQLVSGLSYGEAKKILFNNLNEFLKEPREEYNKLIQEQSYLDSILQEGKNKVSPFAEKGLSMVKKALNI